MPARDSDGCRRAWYVRIARALCVLLAAAIAGNVLLRAGTIAPASAAPRQAEGLEAIASAVREEIAAGHVPGAVVVVGIGDKVVLRQAFGDRAVVPARVPATVDTIFDAASLTKVMATTMAIMQLAERRLIDLDRPAAAYWPALAANGKGEITVRQLLTHYAGLPAGLPLPLRWSGYQGALDAIVAVTPVAPAGSRFVYSDLDFMVLGELVRRVSGQSLDVYCARHIFAPLGLRDTGFRPGGALHARIAPTVMDGGVPRLGEVQDPLAHRMGGVAGHAGLFTTADDLTIFARMLLSGGALGERRILQPASVAAMIRPQSPGGQAALRGLGWDIDSPYSGNLAPFFSPRSFGHTGYTGTALWIDPQSRSFLIVLTSRLHPDGKGTTATLLRRLASLTGRVAAATGGGRRVLPGIDVLEAHGFRQLVGRRIGLITNRSGRDSAARRTADILHKAPGVQLVALFSPEHGLDAAREGTIAAGTDRATGLPVHSLYGDTRRPTDAMLAGIDTLVFDIQDAGARFYTYATTMAYAMEAAARLRLDFFVLDRPNPVTADTVQGPGLDADLTSFVTYLPMPVRHGMTMGELAQLFKAEKIPGVRLHVVRMHYYDRSLWYDQTGLAWVAPSPNLRRLEQVVLYPGVALVEGANVSVGRGTDTPFEVVGAPWIDGKMLADYLKARAIPGIRFDAVGFTPREATFAGQRCQGVSLRVTDRSALDSPLLGLELIAALHRLHGGRFDIDRTLAMLGSRQTLETVKAGTDPKDIALSWTGPQQAFRTQRERHLLY